MKKTMLQILTEVSEGKKSPEKAKKPIFKLLNSGQKLEFNSSELSRKQHVQFEKIMKRMGVTVHVDDIEL